VNKKQYIFLGLLTSFLFVIKTINASCVINGYAPFYKNLVIKAFCYDNYFVKNPILLGQSNINEQGDFNFIIEKNNEQFVFLKIENYRIDFYSEPHTTINLKIQAPDSTVLHLVNQDVYVNYELTGSELNRLIAKLSLDIDWFITQNYQRFLLKSAQQITDTFSIYLKKQYASIPNLFFKQVLNYRLGLLELAAYRSNSYLIETYLSGPILYKDHDYFDFFNQLFRHYLLQFSQTPKGDALYKTINTQGSYTNAYSIFKKDTTIKNDTLRELVFIKGLFDLYYESTYNKNTVLECIKQATVASVYHQNRNIAIAVYEKLTRFFKGNPAPDFELADAKGNTFKLSSFKGKAIVISFGASWNKDYLAELTVLEKYSKRFGKKVQVLNLFLDEPTSIFEEKNLENKNWKLLLTNNSPELLDLYAVKSLPQFFIVSKGGWFIEAHSEPPSKWSPEKFEAFFNVK